MGWDAPSLGVLKPRAEGTPAADATSALPLDRAGEELGAELGDARGGKGRAMLRVPLLSCCPGGHSPAPASSRLCKAPQGQRVPKRASPPPGLAHSCCPR